MLDHLPIELGYKVTDKKRYSCATLPPDAVKYKLKAWTKPNRGCGPLALFTKRQDAIAYIKAEEQVAPKNSFILYRCFYVPSDIKCLHTKIDFKSKNYYESPKRFLSKGTEFAMAIYLYRRCHI